MKLDTNKSLILIVLVFQTILILFQTTIYILFDSDLLDIDNKGLGKPKNKLIETIITLLFIINFIILSFIVSLRGFKNDIITYAISFDLFFLTPVRLYYHYLLTHDPKSKNMKILDKILDITSIIKFFIAIFMIKYLFF